MMSQKVLVVEFDYAGDPDEFERDALRLARPLGNVPGLIWKIWMTNPGNGSFGCLYLFQDRESMEAFIDGPICAQIDQQSQFQDVRMKSYDIMEAPSRLNRAPLSLPGTKETAV